MKIKLMLTKQLFATLLAMILFMGCTKENEPKQICNLADPINELPWLNEIKNSLTNCSCEMSIIQATYKEQTIFYIKMTDMLCDGIETYTLYNCEGKVIEVIPFNEILNFNKKISEIKNLYRCQK